MIADFLYKVIVNHFFGFFVCYIRGSLVTRLPVDGRVKIVPNPDEFGAYYFKFIKMEEEKKFKQKALKDSLLEIEEFFEEYYPIVFYIPPSFIKRIDEIIAEAKRYNFDLLLKKAENLKNDFFKEKRN